MGINRQKQIAQAKLESKTDAEFQAKLLTMLLQAGDYTNEQLISLITDNKKTIEKSLELARAVQGFVASLKDKEIQTIINLPKTVSIENAIDLIEPKWLGKLATDTKAIETKLADIIKAIQDKEVAKQVEVINEVKVAEPRWYKPFDAATFGNKLILGIKDAFRDVLKGVIVKVTSEYPLRVVLTNSAGKPIDTKSLGGGAAVVYGGGGGGGSSSTGGNVGVLNAADARINPATSEGLVDIKTAIEGISIPAPVGGATEANQTNGTQKTQIVDAGGEVATVTDGKLDTNALTDTQLRATPVPMSASSLPLPSGAATAANQQTDALTDAELRATPVPVSGTFYPATQPVSASELPLPAGAATEATLQNVLNKATGGAVLKKTVALGSSGTIHTPSAGKKVRLFSIKFSLSATMTDVAFNFGANPDFEKYLTPKAGGLYGWNTHPDYYEGAVNEALDCVINGAGTVQVNIEYVEV